MDKTFKNLMNRFSNLADNVVFIIVLGAFYENFFSRNCPQQLNYIPSALVLLINEQIADKNLRLTELIIQPIFHTSNIINIKKISIPNK